MLNMSTDVFKQTQTCGGNGDVDEDSQMGRLECFETLSSGTDSNATDERNKVPSYSLSFNSVDGVESRSPSGHSDGAVQPIHDDGDDTGDTKRSPSASLKRAFPSPDKGPEVKTKRRGDLSSSPGAKQSSSSSTPRPPVDYPGMSEHADSSCYDFDPFQVPSFAESLKSPTAFPTPTCFSPECTTPSLQNSNSYESPEVPDFDDLEFDSSKGKVTLWQFLLQLLLDHRYAELIRWTNNAGEFVLLRAEEVARLWGLRKDNNHRMNYDKLSRALRYYYQKNIIRKVHGHKFVYRFIGLNNLKGLTFPTAHLSAENSVIQPGGGRFLPPEANKPSSNTKKSPKTNRNTTTSSECPNNSQSKSYASFSKGLVPGLGTAAANLYFSPPPMADNTVVGGNFLGESLRFPDALPRYPCPIFPTVPAPSVPSVSAIGGAATANSSHVELLHKASRPLGLPLPDYPPIPFYWGLPPVDCNKVTDRTVSNSPLPVNNTTSTSNPITGVQGDFERFLTCFPTVSGRDQVAATTNQAIQGMEMAHERANPKKEMMDSMSQEDRLNVIASLACREVLQSLLQRNSSFHQDHGQGKLSPPFQNPPPTRDTAQASNSSPAISGSLYGRSPTPNCKCSCHHSTPTSDTDLLCAGPLHTAPNVPAPVGSEKTKGWNEIVADLTKEWVNHWKPAASAQDLVNQTDPDRLSDLHYQRHLINMNRLREQLDLLASEGRKQAASRLSVSTANPHAAAGRSNNPLAGDWNLNACAPLLNGSMEFLSRNFPNAPPFSTALESGSGERRVDESYVWMPVQVGLISRWIAMLSGQLHDDLRNSEARREGGVSATHNDLPHVNTHGPREFSSSLSSF